MSNGGIIGPVNDPVTSIASSPGTATFNSSGTYTSGPQAKFVEYLVIAGGGSGGQGRGGGGGAGGFRSGSCFPVTVATPYTITVGGGGAAVNTNSQGNS